jgi:serine/threonine-protein kinase
VSVTVSLGQESSIVPVLAGQTRRTAQLIVERAGLRVGSVTVVPSDEVPEGMVVASDPPAETVLPNGANVALLVSMGPADEALVMPDMIGRPLAPIVRQLESQGFTVLAPAGDGPIVSQDPPAGSRLTRDTPITLRAGRRVVR